MHLCEPLRGTEGLIETVGFKKAKKYVVKNKRECQQGVSSITEGAATLKPREAKVART